MLCIVPQQTKKLKLKLNVQKDSDTVCTEFVVYENTGTGADRGAIQVQPMLLGHKSGSHPPLIS